MRNVSIVGLTIMALCLGIAGCSRGERLNGAGATFPGILYEKWSKDFSVMKKMQVEYQKVGSGKGEQMITQGTVDFAGSDAPHPDKLEEKVSKGLVFLPMTAGSIVLTYNLKDVPKLQLSQKAAADIFLGKIKKWDDAEIAKNNPDVKLPSLDIVVVTRQDKSGTSEIFTGFLSAVSSEFKDKVGKTKEPNFPAGIKADGNQNVMGQINQTDGAIGYVEYGYAFSSKKPMVWLQNKEGEFVEPTPKSGQAALAAIELPGNLVGFEFNPKGKDSYPIVTYTWMMVYKKYDSEKKVTAVKDFIKYCLHDGQKNAEALGYIPLPDGVVAKAEKALEQVGH